MTTYSKDTLRHIFQLPFNANEWQNMLQYYFHATELRKEPEQIDRKTDGEQGYYLGAINTTDSYRIGLFYYKIQHGNIAKKRVGLRKLVASFINPNWGDFDAALVVFDSESLWRLSFVCDIKGDSTATKRYTYVFGEANNHYNTPVERFDELQRKGISFVNLKEAFSVEALTLEFYKKLFRWFMWAKDKKTGITFPNNPSTGADDRDELEIKLIRLITRLMFVWFIKQKHLVPEYLFDVNRLQTILRNFEPLSRNDGAYYNAILQNLFFATLNQEIKDRRFIDNKDYQGKSKDYGDKVLYRDNNKASWFNFPEATKQEQVISLFHTIPYLNGGLFECLDKFDVDINTGKIIPITYYDGFSSKDTRSANGNLKYRAFIPNTLFFAPEHKELVEMGDGKSEQIEVCGIIELFRQYNFTTEENTTSDSVISLDPELLGMVFENLLAAYNPETKDSVRKSTGSYYTPRYIVDYMVDESLIAYLTKKCGHDENVIRNLFNEGQIPSLSEAKQISDELLRIKILDPSCGSGAFPMGYLTRILGILQYLNPEGFNQYEAKLQIIKNCIYGIDIQPIAMLICKLRFFISLICDSEYRPNDPDNNYGIVPLPNLETKFVAANTLLPAKLHDYDEYLNNDLLSDPELKQMQQQLLDLRRSIFDIHKRSDKLKNKKEDSRLSHEILDYIRQHALQPNDEKIKQCEATIAECEKALLQVKDKHIEKRVSYDLFGNEIVEFIDLNKRKRNALKERIRNCKTDIEKEQHKTEPDGFSEAVKQVTLWNPYNQNQSSPFFDAKWMFGIDVNNSASSSQTGKVGFDIVSGNPPYVDAKEQLKDSELEKQRKTLAKDKRYVTLYQKWDLYIAFMEMGIRYLCGEKGIFTMIVPYPLTNQLYAKKMREMIISNYDLFELVDLNGTKIFDATISNCIPFVCSEPSSSQTTIISHISAAKIIFHAFNQDYSKLVQDKKTAVWNVTQEERNGNAHTDMHVLGDYCYISKGMVLNADEKKAKGEFKKADLISATQDDIHCKKYIEGKDLDRYRVKRVRYLEYGTKRSPGELSRPTFEELYTSPKLLINALGEMKAAIDLDDNYYCEQQVRMALLWKELSDVSNKSITSSIRKFSTMSRKDMEELSKTVDLRYLLGIINSKYASVLLSNIRGGDYHIVPEHIRNIPIPSATQEQQQPIIDLVDRILEAKKADPVADTKVMEDKIDQLIYHLYGLTYDEVCKVDPEITISQEEYEE